MNNEHDEIELDLKQLFLALWHRAWVIVLATVLCGTIALGYTHFLVSPIYSANFKMYVNNVSGNTSNISSADLNTATRLVDTYITILKTRTTLETVIESADLPYSYSELYRMISANSVNDTEIFQVQVSSTDPEETAYIANVIADILPVMISNIVDDSSVRVVDYAVVPERPDSPSYPVNILLGALLGFAASCMAIVLLTLFNDTVDSEEILTQQYNIPVLSVIPVAESTHSPQKKIASTTRQ